MFSYDCPAHCSKRNSITIVWQCALDIISLDIQYSMYVVNNRVYIEVTIFLFLDIDSS